MRSIQRPITGRSNWPATNGTSSCITIAPIVLHGDAVAPVPCVDTITPTSAGVTKMPSRLDADAEQTAAGTLPLAIDVNAIDDCTVDGSVQRNSTPAYSAGVTSGVSTGLSARPSSGNSANVLSSTSACSRQCVAPATIASRESFAPCRKNSRPTAMSVAQLNACAASPRHGRKLASTTVPTSASVKLSGTKRERAISGLDRVRWRRRPLDGGRRGECRPDIVVAGD
ncbi:Uncharacterised protein [Burkholderia pseudomallei]|nr:hypothetical protein DO72_5153 [Burkholderia pseudomallei]KGD46830.1 hypothetical protein DP43_3119 [Burkholderia pseudomallei]CAJ3473162.1 Uncharacterised protein [Burkholderia pseudomallei]CAK0043380.1 Uncharacterised protein [Burkholderia pseudomallei]CFV80554.1 Uncharacterised protein [Burkholderia pseudomallei]